MTSTNDGKDVKSNLTSGQKGKSYFIELYKSLEVGLNSECELRDRTQHLCEAWHRVHSLCQHSAPSTHPHLLSWLQRHTAKTILQTEWQSPSSKNEHAHLEKAINAFIQECEAAAATRNGEPPAWESQLMQRGCWFKRILSNPWGHPVLKKLLDTRGEPPSDAEVLEWLKEERGVMFVTRLRQLAASKCDDLAMALASAVMDRVRADAELVPDADQSEEPKETPRVEGVPPTFSDILKTEAGFTVDVWEILTDIEFVLLHKSDKRLTCIELAKQTPLRNGYQLVERLQGRLETSPREKKLWKNAKEVATLIAQVVIARCMVVPVCAGASRSALYCCTRSLARLLARARLPPAAATLAAPAATARHLHTLAAAVHAQSAEDMKPFVCELYVRAITAGMNELEGLKLNAHKESEARSAEQVLALWFQQLGTLLQASDRIRGECTLTAFSLHPSPVMYDRIKAAPALPPVAMDKQESLPETISEFGSWASDSRSQTNLVKTSETLNLKQSQHQANVLSTAILTEGERLGLPAELCQDIAVLLSGPRVKTLSWDMDRELLLEGCRAYMERTHGGTRALTTELKYLNLDPQAYLHLPEEDDDDGNMFYGIEKGYEHLVELQEPEEIWQDPVFDDEETESTYSSCAEIDIPTVKHKKKTRRNAGGSEEDSDPLSLVAEAKRNKMKKERPHSKERSRDRRRKDFTNDPLEARECSRETKKETSLNKEKKTGKRGRKKKDASKSSPLSHLVGMTITKVGKRDRPVQVAPSVTDSDYDSQGKSSLNSLNSDGTEDVLFDGLYSMDELKSPERNSQDDKMGLLKNNEFSVSNGAVAINKGSTPAKYNSDNKVRTGGDTVRSSSPKIPPAAQPCFKTVTEEVKNSITRLIEFRRQKNAQTSTGESIIPASSVASPIISTTLTPRCAIIRPDSPFQALISPKAVSIPDIPKVYINKYQADKLTEMKNEVNQYIHKNVQPQTVLVHGMRNHIRDDMRSHSGMKTCTVAEMVKAQQHKYLNQQNSSDTLNKSQPSAHQPYTPPEPTFAHPMDTDQKNFQNFLKELQQTINAGAAEHAPRNTLPNQSTAGRKEKRPMSRVTPIVPANFRPECRTTPSAKQISPPKKTDNSLNTFSRLSYMHKNKQSDAKVKQVADALIELQSSNTNRPISPNSAELNRISAEHNKIKMKYLKHRDDSSISRADKITSGCKINENSNDMITKFEMPEQKIPSSYEYPVLSNMLHPKKAGKHKYHATKNENQAKGMSSDRQAKTSSGSLSESDQNELILLLRQKKKLNASNIKIHRQPDTRDDFHNNIKPSQTPMPSTRVNKSTSSTSLAPSKKEQRNKPHETYANPSMALALSIQNRAEFKPTQPKNTNVINLMQGQANDVDLGPNKFTNALNDTSQLSTSTEWKSVMNAILAQKTPSRGPKALDVALNKAPFNKGFSDSLQQESVLKTTCIVDSNSMKSGYDLNIYPTAKASTAVPMQKYGQQNVIKSSIKTKKDTARSKHTFRYKPTVKTEKPTMLLNVPIVNNNPKLPTPMQTDLAIPKRQQHRPDFIKTYQSGSSKKQFTSSLPKQDDPFISGIANSDYDLLEELMDDDLRQEIGELSSDDDDYSTPVRSNAIIKNYVSDRRDGGGTLNKNHSISTLNKNYMDQRTEHHSHEVNKTVIQMPNSKRNNAVKTPALTNNCKAPVDRVRSYKMRNETELQVASVLHNMATNTTPKNVNNQIFNVNNNVVINNPITTINQSDVLITAVPQNTFPNVVLIGSDLVNRPYSTIHASNHLQQNTYLSLNNASNMALYQTAEFAAPLVSPLIIANAVTTPMSVTTASTTVVTVPQNAIHSTESTQPELNKPTKPSIHMNPKISQNDINIYNIEPEINSVAQNHLSPPILDNALNENLNKTCERKVLSEVQEKLSHETDSKNVKIQRISFENDKIINEMSAGQERLEKKRLSIINRKINHRCDNEPIPLTYASIRPYSDIATIKLTDLSEAISDPIIMPEANLEKLNVKCKIGDKHTTTTVSDVTSPISNENCKENKTDVTQCRRILLRSSNKLKGKANILNEIPKASISEKVKARQTNTISEFVKFSTADKEKQQKAVTRPQRRVSKRISSNKSQTEAKEGEKNSTNGNKIIKQRKRKIVKIIVPDTQNDYKINDSYKIPVINSSDVKFIDVEDELLGSMIPKNITNNALKSSPVVDNNSTSPTMINQEVLATEKSQAIINNSKSDLKKYDDEHGKSHDVAKEGVERISLETEIAEVSSTEKVNSSATFSNETEEKPALQQPTHDVLSSVVLYESKLVSDHIPSKPVYDSTTLDLPKSKGTSDSTLSRHIDNTSCVLSNKALVHCSNAADDTTVSDDEYLIVSASELDSIASSVRETEASRLTPSILTDDLAACLVDNKKNSESPLTATAIFDDSHMSDSESVTSKLTNFISTPEISEKLIDSIPIDGIAVSEISDNEDPFESSTFYQTDDSTISLIFDTDEEMDFKSANENKKPLTSPKVNGSTSTEFSSAPIVAINEINKTGTYNQAENSHKLSLRFDNLKTSRTCEDQAVNVLKTADENTIIQTSHNEIIKSYSADKLTESLTSKNTKVIDYYPSDQMVTQYKNKELPDCRKSNEHISSLTSEIKQSSFVPLKLGEVIPTSKFRNEDGSRSTQLMLSEDSTSLVADNKEIIVPDSKDDLTLSETCKKEEIAIYVPSTDQDRHITVLVPEKVVINNSRSGLNDCTTKSLPENYKVIDTKPSNGIMPSLMPEKDICSISETECVYKNKSVEDEPTQSNIPTTQILDKEIVKSLPTKDLISPHIHQHIDAPASTKLHDSIMASICNNKDDNRSTPSLPADNLTSSSLCSKKRVPGPSSYKPADNVLMTPKTSKMQKQGSPCSNKIARININKSSNDDVHNPNSVNNKALATNKTDINNLFMPSVKESISTLEKNNGFVPENEVLYESQSMSKQIINNDKKRSLSRIGNKILSHNDLAELLQNNVESGLTCESQCINTSKTDSFTPVNYDKPTQETLLESLSVTDNDMSHIIPQSYKDTIQIEHLPNTSDDPWKKCVRIKLPNGRIFKATVHGQIHVDFDTLFAQPSMKSLLLSSLTDMKRYTLNVKQTSTTALNNPGKILETRIQEVNIAPNKKDSPIETINLLSDDEEEDLCDNFKTEFGTFKIHPENKNAFIKHQKKFNQKCRVMLIDIQTKSNRTCLPNSDIPAPTLIKGKEINTGSVVTSLLCTEISSNTVYDTLESNSNSKIIPPGNGCVPATATNIFSDKEIIEIDDSSNDSCITKNNTKPALQLNNIFKPKDKINELKDLLLKDFGVEGNKQTLADNFQKEIERYEISSRQDITDRNGDASIEKCYNCFVKVTRCDDLVKKCEKMKIMMQKCFVKLVRCDDIICLQSRPSENNNFYDETSMDYENKGHVALPTSCDNSSIVPSPIIQHGRTSPVVCIFETIALLQSKDNVKDTLQTTCRAEDDFYRCNSEWLMTKSSLFFQKDTYKDFVTTSDTDFVNSKSEIDYNETLIVPSLMTLLASYFRNSSIVDQLTPLCALKNHNTSKTLKRKIVIQNYAVATKIPKIGDKKSTRKDSPNIGITKKGSILKHNKRTPIGNSVKVETAHNEKLNNRPVREDYLEGQMVDDTSNISKIANSDRSGIKSLIALQKTGETEGIDIPTKQNDKFICDRYLLEKDHGFIKVDLSNKSEEKTREQLTSSAVNNFKMNSHTNNAPINKIDYDIETFRCKDIDVIDVNKYTAVEKNKETLELCDKNNRIDCEIAKLTIQSKYDTDIKTLHSDTVSYCSNTTVGVSYVELKSTASNETQIYQSNNPKYYFNTEVEVSEIIEDFLNVDNIVVLKSPNDNLYSEIHSNNLEKTKNSLNEKRHSVQKLDSEISRNYEGILLHREINNTKAQQPNNEKIEMDSAAVSKIIAINIDSKFKVDSRNTLNTPKNLVKADSLPDDESVNLEKHIYTNVKYSKIENRSNNERDKNPLILGANINVKNNSYVLKNHDKAENSGEIVKNEISKNHVTVNVKKISDVKEPTQDQENINIGHIDHKKYEYQTKIIDDIVHNKSFKDDVTIIVENNDCATNESHETETKVINVNTDTLRNTEILNITDDDQTKDKSDKTDIQNVVRHYNLGSSKDEEAPSITKNNVEVFENNKRENYCCHKHTIPKCTIRSDKMIKGLKSESQTVIAKFEETNKNNSDNIILSDASRVESNELFVDQISNKNVIIRSDIPKDPMPCEYEKTSDLNDYSDIMLKGIEYEDPIVGTCYVFSIIKSDSSENDSDGLNGISEEVIQGIQDISGQEDVNLKVLVPKNTYSRIHKMKCRKNLKRRLDMTDIKIKMKKYRKGKNIDYPKFTISSLSDTAYCKEYKCLFDYFSSVTFSYSRPFHKEYIDVHELLKAWPLNNTNINVNKIKIETNQSLFIDMNTVEKPKATSDPIKQTLAEELRTEYDETNYSSIEINETNFNMGFGEGSDRVIKKLIGGDGSKISAATLSDVKQSQPLLLSKDYDDHINYQSNYKKTQNDKIENLRRYITNIQQRDKVRAYFRKTTVELNLMKDLEKCKASKMHSNEYNAIADFPFGLNSLDFIQPNPVQTVAQVVQVGQLPVSAAAQNPVTCDPRVTQVSDASPPQCSAENSPLDDSQSAIKTEYTELTTADLTLSMGQDYTQHTMPLDSHEASNVQMTDENIPVQTEIKSVVKIELMEEFPGEKEPNEPSESNGASNSNIISNVDYSFDPSTTNASSESDSNIQNIFNSTEKQMNTPEPFSQQKQQNCSSEKTDQIAHAMNAAGITTTAEPITNSRAQALVNILSHKIRQGGVGTAQSTTNSYPKTTTINAMALQQALAQILPPPLNQTNGTENNQQSSNTPQLLHIVQGKNASGNQITLVDNTQQSVISSPNAPVLHIVQNKGGTPGVTQNTAAAQSNSFIVDAGLQQGGNQLLHIVNTGSQKNNNAGQLLKKINLLTNLTNVSGSNEQKMVQFVCKSADGKAIQLNAGHQRGMVLRIQPMIESTNIQSTTTKPVEAQEPSSTSSAPNSVLNKEAVASQQEIKSRSVYEENYAKFIQNSSTKQTVSEKSTSLPKFNQAFGKQVFQDNGQKQEELNSNSQHMASMNNNVENTECQPTENTVNLEHINQLSSPPLLLRKSPVQTSQPQQNLVQQIKQSVAPMNLHSMHGGVIYTRQIPLNIGGGQTINLITVPSTELIDDAAQKQQSDVKFVNQSDLEQSIIKIVPQSQSATNAEVTPEENTTLMGASSENAHNSQQPVLTQMRIKLPMLSKAPQMVSGARVVRPSFFQIQRNVIGGANQPVYQQLVLTAAPPMGQQTIRLPQVNTQTNRHIKVPSESQTSPESQMSSSTLEQLREFDLVLEQVKERSTVQPNANSTKSFAKLHNPSADTTDGAASASSTSAETTQHIIYSIGNNQPLNVAYVNRKAANTPTTSTYVRSPDSSGIIDSSTSSHVQLPHTVTVDSPANETPVQTKSTKVSSKTKSRPKASSNPPNTLKLNPVPPKPSAQKPLEDEQTTQRILYILAEYKEQVENSPDKDKPAPRRRSNPPLNPSGSSKRKKSSSGSRRSGTRDMSPVNGEDTCRTMGSEDSSCGTSQGDCNESCVDSHSPQDSPRKVVRKLTFEPESPAPQPRPQPQRNVIVADGQTITVARSATGKPTTAVLMPANYILPVSMVKGGQQIAIVTNRGPKLLTVGGGEGGATNALLLQRLIGPAGLKPVLARPGVRHVRLPTAALHNLQAFNLATATSVQPPDSTASPAPTPTPDLADTRATSSPWTDREAQEMKPERGSSPEGSEPWNLPSSADYTYEETARTDNMDRTVLDAIPDRYSPDMEAQRIFDKMFDVDSRKSYIVDSPRCGFDIDTSDCDDKAYHQVVHKRDGSSQRQHRLAHVSAAALRHKYAILEHELRLQKSLSEECEDLGVDSPSASELFPEAELLFVSSPAHEHAHDHMHDNMHENMHDNMHDSMHDHMQHSITPQASFSQSCVPQPDMDDQIATDHLLARDMHERELNLGLEDVGIVTVSEDGMQATIALDQEEFARSHPNTTFHSEPTDDVEVQPFTISGVKSRHITSTIFHSNRPPATVLMTAPQATVISQVTGEGSSVQHAVKYCDIENMINSLPGAHAANLGLASVVVKDDGLARFDGVLGAGREPHPPGAAHVIRRVCYDHRKRAGGFLADGPDGLLAGDDAKMAAEDSSRDATLESMAGDVDDDRSSPERHAELFWESTSEGRRPLDFSSDSDKCCKSPSCDETNSTDSGGGGAHVRLDSVIKQARCGVGRGGSADGSSADDAPPPLRTYPAKRALERSTSGKTRAGERFPDGPGPRRRASGRGVVKRGCHCCGGSPTPPRPKKSRQRKPTLDFNIHH